MLVAIGYTTGDENVHDGWVGGSDGASTFLAPDMPGDYTLIVLANVDPPIAMTLQGMVRGWLTAK